MGPIALAMFTALILLLCGQSGARAQPADSPWPMFRGNAQHTGVSPYDTSRVNGTKKWRFATGGGIESSPAIGRDSTIYFGSHDNKLYAVNPDGTLKWHFAAGDGPVYSQSGTPQYSGWKGILSSPAIAADGTIYFSSLSNKLFALNPDGTKKWDFDINLSIDVWSSPTVGPDGTIYIGSHDNFSGKLYAINPDGTRKWAFTTQSCVGSSPAISPDGTIYVGSGDHHVYAINPDGTQKWRFETGKHVESSPAVGKDGTVYVGSADNNVYAINPNGTEKWRFVTGGPEVFSSPAIGADGTIYIGSGDKNLYALDPSGTERWRFTTGGEVASPTIGADGTVYVGSLDHNLYALDPAGREKWRFATRGSGIVASPAIGADGTVYFGSWDKYLYALGGLTTSRAAAGEVRVLVNGRQVQFDVAPVIESGRTLVPMRAILEAIGATVKWDGATRTVTATRGGTTAILTIGSRTARINGQRVTLDVPAKVVDGRTLVPLRFLSERLGEKVDWDGQTRTITITH